MSQVIQIHIGQAGIRIGEAVWELLCKEEKVDQNGQSQDVQNDFVFKETSKGLFTPRATFLDCDDQAGEEIKKGNNKNLFSSSSFVLGKESAVTFCRGRYLVGKGLMDELNIYKQLENCDKVAGVIITRSICGGTGSGVGVLVQQYLENQKIPIFDVAVMPSPNISNLILEPYESMFAIQSQIEHNALTICVDNEQMYKLCEMQDIELPNYQNLNQIIAQIVSSLTLSNRSNSLQAFQINQLETNLVPYKGYNFIQPSITFSHNNPFVLTKKIFKQNMSSFFDKPSKYISNAILFRGNYSPFDVSQAICNKKYEFEEKKLISWLNNNFKVGINTNQMIQNQDGLSKQQDGAFMFSNSTSAQHLLTSIKYKFQKLHNRRPYFGYYIGEGMANSEFREALSAVESCIKNYQNMEQNDQIEI